MRILTIGIILLALSGCVSKSPAELHAERETQCRFIYNFKKGSKDFMNCMVQLEGLELQKQANRIAAFNNQINMNNAINNNMRRSVTCNGLGNRSGTWSSVTCY